MEDLIATELKNMTINVVDESFGPEYKLSDDTILRWQRLFGCLSKSKAVKLLEHYRNDLTRPRVSDEHWSIVRTEKEAEDYDRESYEYSLGRERNNAVHLQKSVLTTNRNSKLRNYFILKLEESLSTAIRIQEAARLNTLPKILIGEDSCGEASFVRVDSFAKEIIQKWLCKK